jgi:hypothetical protein
MPSRAGIGRRPSIVQQELDGKGETPPMHGVAIAWMGMEL